MEDWLIWLILAAVLGIGEMLTLGLFLLPFAGGALAAALVSAFGMPLFGSVAIFVVVAAILLAALRPIAQRHRRSPPKLRTGAAALVGQSATVIERIANEEGVGLVRLGGEVWTARTYLDGETIDAGRQVQVVEIRGATALVSE